MDSQILNDPREIIAIEWFGENNGQFNVGSFGCEQIKAYAEPGIYGEISYLAVTVNGEIKARVPAYMVSVYYKPEAK